MENEPEKGIRCTMCFDMRFERTALYAAEHGFSLISSSLGISRWKNMQQINGAATVLLHIMQAFTTGTITGANMAVRYACWTSANVKNFINKSTVAACIHCGIATAGA